MLCIAAFIVFVFLGIFSLRYRKLAIEAWGCVGKRVTFRPCDSTFSEDVKGMLTGAVMKRSPWLGAFVLRWIDLFAWIFVILSIWSLISVMLVGLNLWIYDTCDPGQPESCALGGESCSINTTHPGFIEAVQQGKVGEWTAQPFITLGDTFSRIPDRLKTWQATDYLPANPTYYNTFDDKKPTALEVVDPGCIVCRKLFQRIKETDFASRYNLTYIAYPIPTDGIGTKFPFSRHVAEILEALKILDAEQGSNVARDWQFLERIFDADKDVALSLQNRLNTAMTEPQAEETFLQILKELRLTEKEVARVQELRHSDTVAERLRANRILVEDRIRTLKIPTLLFDGRRFDRLPELGQLKP